MRRDIILFNRELRTDMYAIGRAAIVVAICVISGVGAYVASAEGFAFEEKEPKNAIAGTSFETEHGRISITAGETPGIWISSKKSKGVVCIYIEPTRGQPVIGMYGDETKANGGCNVSVSCERDGTAYMQISKDGKPRILELSKLFDAIQAFDQSVKQGDTNR